MFEKLLQAIEKDPSPQKRQAFLALVAQTDTPQEKAEALAQYARLTTRVDPLGALSTMQFAWRLAPENARILDEVKRLFLTLRRGEAAAEIERLRAAPIETPLAEKGLELDLAGFLDADDATKGSPNPRNGHTVSSPMSEPLAALDRKPEPHPETAAPEVDFLSSLDLSKTETPSTASAAVSEPTPFPSIEPFALPDPPELEPLQAPDFPGPEAVFEAPQEIDLRVTAVESLPAQEAPAEPQPEASPPQPPPRIAVSEDFALTFSDVSGRKHYAVFMEYVRASGLDFRLLEFAEGFSDSLLGLVHFVHYLQVTGKLSGPSLEKAVASLKQRVMSDVGDIKSQVRFLDLFEPVGGG